MSMSEDYKKLDIYKCFKESELHSTKAHLILVEGN